MDYKIQLKPFEKKDGVKYKILEITDFTLHTNHKKPTKSFGKKIKQAFKLNKSGRIYSLINNQSDDQKIVFMESLKKDPDFIKMIREEEKNGYKILIQFPSEGIPILAGEDTKEFIKSNKGKRILRRIAKKKPVGNI